MKANRFYLLCAILSLFYISSVLHEIVIDSYRNEIIEAGKPNDFLNRSVAFKLETNNIRQFCRAPRIAILISAKKERRIQLYWNVEYVQDGDWIALFDDNPQVGEKVFPIFTASVYNATGIIRTNFTLTDTPLSTDLKFTTQCLGYWAAYFLKNKSEAETVSCLKTNPTWMYDIRKYIENVPIKRIFIPGTHDAGAYSSKSENIIVERYVITQDEDILGQLIMGIRYLDIRISYQSNTPEKWWINHGLVSLRPLMHVLKQLKTFLINTREIVILDFHGFPAGFENQEESSHQAVVQYLKSELSEWMAFPNWNSTCGELWKSNKTLIVTYNYAKVVTDQLNLLWPPVHHRWANAQNIDELKEYFNKVIDGRPSYSWAAMAELTPRLWGILTLQAEPLRNMAEIVNPHITNWFRGIWGRYCNIVAVDFFRGTDLVHTAIEWNVRKHLKRICDIY